MAIQIKCPSCSQEYTVDESRAGKKLKCKCGEVFRAPVANAEVTLPASSSSTMPIDYMATSNVPPRRVQQTQAATSLPPAAAAATESGTTTTGRSGTSTRYEVEPYQAEGGFTAHGVGLLVLFTFSAAIVLGIVAGFIHQWFYLIFLFPLFIGFGVGFASHMAIEYGHVRNRIIAGVCSFIAGCLAMVVMHYYDYMRFQSTLRAELAKQPPAVAAIIQRLPELMATREKQPPEIQAMIVSLEKKPQALQIWQVHSFPSYLDYRAHAGVSLKSVHDVGGNAKGLNLGYIGTYIYWMIEALIVACIAFVSATFRASKPYCSQCSSWKEVKQLGSVQPPVENAIAALRSGELLRLRENHPLKLPGEFTASAAVCPKCQENSTIDVKLEQAVRNNKGRVSKKELAHMTYPGNSLRVLENLFTTQSASPSAPA
jgi:hypothetical protein